MRPHSLWLSLVFLCCGSASLRAAQVGLFTYQITGGKVEITDYPESATGVVEIPSVISGFAVTKIGTEAFSKCRFLTGITIPPGVTLINYRAFSGCSGLKDIAIPASVTSIAQGAFEDCTGLTRVMIPASVISLDVTFFGCRALEGIDVAPGNTQYTSVEGVLYNASRTTVFRCPEGKTGAYTIRSGTTSINGDAFSSCTRLTDITIPASVTAIGSNAFYICTGLTDITIPASVTSIGWYAFYGCIRLTGITIPASVTEIGNDAFHFCTALERIDVEPGNPSYVSFDGVLYFAGLTLPICCPQGKTGTCTIPSGVTTLHGTTESSVAVFHRCSRLTRISLPASLTLIGDDFYLCTSLEGIDVAPGNPKYTSVDGVLYNAALTTLVACPARITGAFTVPSGVTSIGARTFYGCTQLSSVVLPASVSSIPEFAFYGCTALTAVTLTQGLTSIRNSAFSGCRSLTTVTIPPSVINISSSAFSNCAALENIEVETGNLNFASRDGVLYDASWTTLVACPGARSGGFIILDGVTAIGENAFRGCALLTNVACPGSVIAIRDEAFYGCTGLTDVSLLHGITTIGYGAFFNCSGLSSISIPASVTYINWVAFSGCIRLTAIHVTAGNTKYASVEGILYNASRTTLIRCPAGKPGICIVPPGVAIIDGSAFYGCRELTGVSLPDSLTSISSSAFASCRGLTSITIPAAVISLGGVAFGDCPQLTSLVFLGNAPSFAGPVFSDPGPGLTFYFLSSRTGFTSPAWNGLLATMINEETLPVASWLLAHGLKYDASLDQDPNSDGVSLLLAYALDLDPRRNLRASLPVPVVAAEFLSLSFHATSPGITYRVETSTDLQSWTAAGVSQSDPGPDHRSTATVPLGFQSRYLRLKVSN